MIWQPAHNCVFFSEIGVIKMVTGYDSYTVFNGDAPKQQMYFNGHLDKERFFDKSGIDCSCEVMQRYRGRFCEFELLIMNTALWLFVR